METGLRYTTNPIFGSVKGTVRTVLGERFSIIRINLHSNYLQLLLSCHSN